MLFLNVYAESYSGAGNTRERLRNAIDKAFSDMPREAQRAFQRTTTLLRNNSGGIVAGGNKTTTVTLSRKIPRNGKKGRSKIPRERNGR